MSIQCHKDNGNHITVLLFVLSAMDEHSIAVFDNMIYIGTYLDIYYEHIDISIIIQLPTTIVQPSENISNGQFLEPRTNKTNMMNIMRDLHQIFEA